jgi:protoporphyrinogen oxidase
VRYGLIGAGALGLTVALRLVQRGHEVVVLERDPVPGGLAGSFEVAPGLWLEKFYHHLFKTDTNATRVIDELGLTDRLHWYQPRTTVFVNGESRPLDSPMAVLRFSPLSLFNRLRLAMGVAFLRLLPNPGVLEGRTAGRWVRQVMGNEVYDTVWGPLLRGKFHDSANEVSMPWLWARIHDRTPKLGYLHGGFHQLYAALAEQVTARGGTILYGAAASEIRSTPDGGVEVDMTVKGERRTERFDRVISTLATALTVKLTPEMPADFLERHPAPKALGAHCLILDLDRPLTADYWIGNNEPDIPFLAVVEHTNMVPPEAYGGRHLLYLGNYRPHDDPLFGWSTDEVLDNFEEGIRRLNPAFDRSWVQQAWSFGAPFAQPVVTPAFARTIPGFDTPVKGLYVANMFQVYPHDRGQNYSIALAERLVGHLES